MNAVVRKVTGTFNVVSFVPDDKLDQLAALLGLNDDQAKQLKQDGNLILVQDSPTPSS